MYNPLLAISTVYLASLSLAVWLPFQRFLFLLRNSSINFNSYLYFNYMRNLIKRGERFLSRYYVTIDIFTFSAKSVLRVAMNNWKKCVGYKGHELASTLYMLCVILGPHFSKR